MSGLIYPPPASTAANQQAQTTVLQTGTSIATVIMNDQGTLATAANQTVNTAVISSILNSQGTVFKSVIWGTGTGAGVDFVAQQVRIDNNRLLVSATFDDTMSLDAFSRLRVSSPAYRFDGQFTYESNTDTWDNSSTSGSLAYDFTNRLVTLANDAGTNVSVLQSHYHSPYTPGRSQLVFLTFNFKTAPTSGVTKRAGYFDGNNGIFLEWDATVGVSVNIVSDTANGSQQVTQANWNVDKLNGAGASGYTIDLTKVQILFVSFQALYTGRVIVGFDIDGRLVPVHQFTHANKVVYPYTQQASQPVRFEVRGTNATGARMDCICASVLSEGGGELLNLPGRAFSYNITTGTSVTSRVPMLSVRCKQVFNGVRNQAIMVPQQITANSTTNPCLIELVRNGTVSPSVFLDVDSANSMVERSESGTAITGGQTVYSCMCSKDWSGVFPINTDVLGRLIGAYSHVLPVNPADTFTIVVTALNASSSVTVGFNWKEIR